MAESFLSEGEIRKICFNTYLDFTTDGLIAVDRSGRIIMLNHKYADILGVPAETAIGKNINDVIPISEMSKVMDLGQSEQDVLRFINTTDLSPESKHQLIILNRTAVRDHNGNVIGAVGYIRTYAQIRSDFSRLNPLYLQMSSAPEEAFQTATKKAHSLVESQTSKPSPTEMLVLQLQYYQDELRHLQARQYPSIIGSNPAFLQTKIQASRIAKTDFSVSITGESGAGKEVFAHLIHASSKRADHPLIIINCAAIPAELLESELFGYKKGSFTGANREGKLGKIAAANGGTIFLDEIGDMPLSLQSKLLRVLDNHEIEPIGATSPQKIDVRFISATSKNLEQMVAEGTFRQDLYFRITELRLSVLPLRDRVDDIPLLAQSILDKINHKYGSQVTIPKSTLRVMQHYRWPGNIRELSNVIKAAYCMAENGKITVSNLPQHITSYTNSTKSNDTLSLQEQLDREECRLLTNALKQSGYNLNLMAKQLHISRSTLYKKLAKYNLHPKAHSSEKTS